MTSPLRQPMQAAPSAQQASPQSDLMAQRKAAYDQLNSFMQNEYMPTITKDTQFQQMRARLQQLNLTINQNRTSFLNSLGFTEDKLRDPNLNPAIRNFLSAGLTSWVRSQPEYQQIQQTNNNVERYIQQTYPELVIKQKTLSNLANPQMKPIVPTYGDPSIQAQPINPTQQQSFENAQSEAVKKANEEFKERISRPNRPFQQDPIVDPKRPTTTGPKKITPIERPPVEPIVDPIKPTTTVPTTITPIKPPQQDPIVDPIREPYKPIKTITPVKRPPVEPIVDPIREPYTPPKPITPVKPVQKDPIVDPIRPMAPAKTGLMKQKSINPYVPMGYKSLNTNVTKGLMNR